MVGADCQLQIEATWGLCRTAERKLQIDGLYPYNAEGEGVSVYIVDTGIYLQHTEFEGRAEWGFDAVDSPSPREDLNGHGTHCAGTVMSKNFGLAKKAKSVAVRVLDADGSGSNAGVMAGVAYVGTEGSKKKGKAVANLSLGGSFSAALNAAVKAVVEDGIPFVVAAGNEAQDSCNASPASEATAITVMASDSDDGFAYFSNYGKCTNIIAPGVGITSTWIGSQYSINTISGTSMAAPHVAGVVAKMLGAHEEVLTPDEVLEHLLSNATESTITKIPASTKSPTPNVLLYAGCYEI
jgi:subtilisin family serine protease